MSYLNRLICPVCNNSNLFIKYEATYVYSYAINGNAPGTKNTIEFLPYLYDNREQTETKQYIECNFCKAKFPCVFDQWDNGIDIDAIQESINKENRIQSENWQ